jgi:hypothetical protein
VPGDRVADHRGSPQPPHIRSLTGAGLVPRQVRGA